MRTKHGASAEAVDEIGANSLLVGCYRCVVEPERFLVCVCT